MSATQSSDDRGITTVNGDAVVVEGESVSGTQTRTKVVVVGAGIAGVTAAAKLIHNGIQDVVVLEAQDYIGGRIKATMVGDETIDMGAMFVHGQVGNPMYEIVQRLEVEADSILEVPHVFCTSKGEKVPFQEIEDLYDILKDTKESLPGEVGQSKREVIVNLYNQFLRENQICDDHPKRELYDAVLGWKFLFECVFEACSDLDQLSAWADLNFVVFGGNQHTLMKDGYSTVMRSFLNLIPEKVIRTQTPVHSIDWANSQDGGISVRCANGDVFTADHVIVTISLGCLKAVHDSMFSPPLPGSFLNSIERLEFGCIGKLFLRWDTPFWNKEMGVAYSFFRLETDHPLTLKQDKSKQKTCMEVLEGVDDQEVCAVLQELLQVYIRDTVIPMPSAVYKSDWKNNPYIRGTYTHCTPSIDATDVQHLNRPVFPSPQNPRLLFAGESFTPECMTTVHGAFMTGEDQAERILKANGINEFARVADVISYN